LKDIEILLRACLVKVRVKPVDVLEYAEDLSLMALFGRNATKMEEATLQKRPTRGCSAWKRSRFGFFKSNPIAYQTGSNSSGKDICFCIICDFLIKEQVGVCQYAVLVPKVFHRG
jgi:hypothetical protein